MKNCDVEDNECGAQQKFKPFYLTNEHLELPSQKCIVDIPGDNLIRAAPTGSYIFSKEGLNYLVAGEGADLFFFSLCSTKPRNGETTVIENFNVTQDEIYFFCTKKEIPNATPIYDSNVTILEVDDSAISILGEHENIMDVVHLNIKWVDYHATHDAC